VTAYSATMSGSEAVNQHLVSRGLQKNVANGERRVALLDARTGLVVATRKSTRSNFAEDHFNSFVKPDGTRAYDLEDEWGKIESTALDRIRSASSSNAHEDKIRAAVCEVFALHIVRSQAFQDVHRRIAEQVVRERTPALVTDDEVLRRFVDEFGRQPNEGELKAAVERVAADREQDNTWFVGSMARHYTEIVTRFANRHVQIIETAPGLPGFVLADVPVVHADSRSHRYGFADDLAIDDANLIIGPLTRTTAACLTTTPTSHKVLKTKKLVQLVNAVFWRNAQDLIACHPDDVRESKRVFDHLDELPVSRLVL
jgi:hypothetical protein